MKYSLFLQLAGAGLVTHAIAAPTEFASFSVSEVQDWLKDQNLQSAFGDYFVEMEVDGQLLWEYMTPDDINLANTPKATGAHVRRLFGELKKLKRVEKRTLSATNDGQRRKLSGDAKSRSGISIQRDDAFLAFGTEADVSLSRSGDNELTIDADTVIISSHDAIVDGDGISLLGACKPWTQTFVSDNAVSVKQSQLLTTTFQAAADYEITIDIKPWGTFDGWSNIFHFTVTGDNCCSYGDRIPGVWIKKNSGTVLLVSGSAYDLDDETEDGNSHGYSDIELPMDQWTTVVFKAEGPTATISFNGTEVLSIDTDIRHPHDNTQVYLSDPWYEPAHADVKNFKYRALSLVQSGGYDHDTDSQSSLGQLDHTTVVPFDLKVSGSVTVDSFSQIFTSDGAALTDTLDKWPIQFVGQEEVLVKRDQLLTSSFQAAADFEITVDIMPYGTYNGWSNIFHFTATDDNCCNYGDRIPALWLKANSGTVLLVSGSAYDLDDEDTDGNAHGYSSVELEEDEWTRVTIRAVGGNATVTFNGENVLTMDTDTRHPHDHVRVYMSDPWYQPAPVYVKNFKYRVLSYVQSEAYGHSLDSESSLGQTDTVFKVFGDIDVRGNMYVPSYDNVMDSAGLSLSERSDEGVTTFLGDSAIAIKKSQLITPSFQAAAEYEISLDIKLLGTYNGWSNIFHFTVTGDNCCNYGDRIPAAWLKANTGTVLYVSGSAYDLDDEDDDGNAHGYSDTELPLNEWIRMKFQAIGGTSKLYFNDTLVLSLDTDTRHPHDGAYVYLSDPWYQQANAMVKNFQYRTLSLIQSDAYEHEFDSAGALGQY